MEETTGPRQRLATAEANSEPTLAGPCGDKHGHQHHWDETALWLVAQYHVWTGRAQAVPRMCMPCQEVGTFTSGSTRGLGGDGGSTSSETHGTYCHVTAGVQGPTASTTREESHECDMLNKDSLPRARQKEDWLAKTADSIQPAMKQQHRTGSNLPWRKQGRTSRRPGRGKRRGGSRQDGMRLTTEGRQQQGRRGAADQRRHRGLEEPSPGEELATTPAHQMRARAEDDKRSSCGRPRSHLGRGL